MPIVKPISGHTSCKGIYRYLTKRNRALASDYLNLDVPERDGDDPFDWAEVMDDTRRRNGNDRAWGGHRARTYKHYVLSPDPEDGIGLDALRELATAWAEKNFTDYEVAIVYHDDNERGIPHAHVVVNNTNLATGKRLQDPDPKALKHSAQEMARGRHLRDLDTDMPQLDSRKPDRFRNAPTHQAVYRRRSEKAIEAEGGEKPVEFEAVTALAFLWFAREKCDLVVLETGLGGRCDATNVVPHKLVAAITKIGYDHMEVLGDTLDKIAAEKAGIIKEGTVVVNYPDQPAEAMGPILTAAAEAHTSIITPDKDDLTLLRGKRLENRIDYGGYRAALGLPGTHQANHAAMAVEIALALWREFGYDISDDAILQGLADARMPARIEVLRRHPLLLLDGCHNPDGAKMLAATLTRADFEENLVGVLGVLADKDYKDMLSDLAPCFAKIYTVTPAH